jgi:hypothetical protein
MGNVNEVLLSAYVNAGFTENQEIGGRSMEEEKEQQEEAGTMRETGSQETDADAPAADAQDKDAGITEKDMARGGVEHDGALGRIKPLSKLRIPTLAAEGVEHSK